MKQEKWELKHHPAIGHFIKSESGETITSQIDKDLGSISLRVARRMVADHNACLNMVDPEAAIKLAREFISQYSGPRASKALAALGEKPE